MFNHSRHRLDLNSPLAGASRSWDDDLLDARRYQEVFDALRARVAARPSMLLRARRTDTIGLRWLLGHQELVTRRILEALVSSDFELGAQRKVEVFAGKGREIYVAEWPDRIVLMVMGRILSERLEQALTDRVFSFRRGRSHWDALRELRAFLKSVPAGREVHIVRRDISKYGDSIDQERALGQAETRLGIARDSIFGRVLAQGIRVVYELDGNIETLRHGIPSGSPLCPPLENLYLDELDRRMLACCHSMAPSGAFYARYGDDFLLATDSEACAASARAAISTVVEELGLTASANKALDVTIRSADQGFEWLGLRVSRQGLLGCKRGRWREARRRVSGEMTRFVQLAYRAELNEAQRIELLREGLRQILEPSSNRWLGSMVFEQDDPRALRELDRFFSRHLAETLGKQHGGRRAGWRLFRKLGYRSLLHARAAHRWR